MGPMQAQDDIAVDTRTQGVTVTEDPPKGRHSRPNAPSGVTEFLRWMENDIGRWKRDAIEIVEYTPNKLVARIYTETNSYQIVAKAPVTGDDDGYLGCTSSCRKPRPGEHWTRGNDLPDGPLNEHIWRRILADIVGYEIVSLAKGVNKTPPHQIE